MMRHVLPVLWLAIACSGRVDIPDDEPTSSTTAVPSPTTSVPLPTPVTQITSTPLPATYDDPFVEEPDACASQDECLEGTCQRPPGPCDTGPQPPSCEFLECESQGRICGSDSCGQALCVDDCRPDPAQCGAMFVCGSEGVCEPTRCESGSFTCAVDQVCEPGRPGRDERGCSPARCAEGEYTCAADHVCDPTRPSRDEHGCSRDTCTSDDDCPTGRCGAGFCRPEPYGICSVEDIPFPP